METQGVVTHPIDGAYQPQGTLSYHRPFALTGTGRWWISRAWYPAPMEGTCIPGAPGYSAFGREDWGRKSPNREH